MACSTIQIEVGVFLYLNTECLMDQLKEQYLKQINRRKDFTTVLYLRKYDDLLKDDMRKFLMQFISETFGKNIEETYVLVDQPYIQKQIERIIRRSIYE